jgi:hypothetical protein
MDLKLKLRDGNIFKCWEPFGTKTVLVEPEMGYDPHPKFHILRGVETMEDTLFPGIVTAVGSF